MNTTKRIFFICYLIVCSYTCVLGQRIDSSLQKPAKPVQFPTSTSKKLTYKVIPGSTTGFGFDIYSDNKLMIHQPTIPAIAGNVGFKSKAEAEKVAQLMMEKIKNNIMPPSISVKELEDLKITMQK